ncbi:hypothetical protein GP486_003863 [Trichoglossum hirsutum]|uniref:E3 ubiquitin-protein ligase listerin n=1 Tax=Trichoglossum hirsutum TaxID=265104 RepID=A0A9P8LC48_9PEZI|nr:hypothetical protein GP486_003863 [Trichoglossum hirsutum]
MSKRQYKPQASASRAASNIYGASFGGFNSSSGLGATTSSLSFVFEPPDLSAVSEPNVVVAFKNLLKKDSTTKAKALEDLLGYISSLSATNGGVEDGVLEAWIKLYPRTSVDSARRVRQLAHVLQGQISVSSGRRMAKHMSKIAGAWLAGMWDNDRLVSRAAHDSIKDVFGTEKKRHDLLIIYGRPILEYTQNAVLRETVQSLSDERVVSPDNAKEKYARVVSTSICVTTHMLSSLTSNLNEISVSFLPKALAIDQSGSAWDYIMTLSALTTAFPTIWTDSYTGKKPPSRYLRLFLKRGSRGGPPEFWDNVSSIFRTIFPSVLSREGVPSVIELLGAYREGITSSQEPKSNSKSAWTNYFAIAAGLLALLTETKDRKTLLYQSLFPLFEEYLRHAGAKAQSSISTQDPGVLATGFRQLAQQGPRDVQELLELEWRRLADLLVEDIKTSLPEQSNDFEKSQNSLKQELKRWFSMQGILLGESGIGSFDIGVCAETTVRILNAATEILKSRNGEAYGAATAISAVLQNPRQLLNNDMVKEVISTFVKSDLPSLVLSPSSPTLISVLYSYAIYSDQESLDFQEAWTATVQTILLAPEESAKLNAIKNLLRCVPKDFDGLKPNPDLDAYILRTAGLALGGKEDGWEIVNEALRISGRAVSGWVVDHLLSDLASSLTVNDKAAFALQGVDSIARSNKDQLKNLLQTKKGSEILSNIVFLTELSNEELAYRAESTNTSIRALLSDGNASQSLVGIVKNGLLEASPSSISIRSLVSRAQRLLGESPPESSRQLADLLLPHSSQWELALQPFLEIAPKTSMAITDPLASCVFMVERTGITDPSPITRLPRDSNGYSIAIRIASYTVNLLKDSDVFALLDQSKQAATFKGIVLAMQLANDNLGLAGANNLWNQYSPDIEEDMLEFVSDAHSIVVKMLRGGINGVSLQPNAQEGFWMSPDLKAYSAEAFYMARASSTVYSELVELHGFLPNNASIWMEALTEYRKNNDIFSASALVSGISQSMALSREFEHLRDRLISDLSGHDIKKDLDKGLRDLILLNAVLADIDETATPLPRRRLVVFIKHITTWTEINPLESITAISERLTAVTTEVAKIFVSLLPQIKDLHDSFWVWIIEFLEKVWLRICSPEPSRSARDPVLEDDLPAIHATLKLYAMLDSVRAVNVELEKEWSSRSSTLVKYLFHLLKLSPSVPDDFHQPLKVVNNLLSRQIVKLPPDRITEPSELYSLLSAESPAVQQSAFEILHRYIPSVQENISLNVALDGTTAKLPEELLSLTLGAPTLDDLDDLDFERSKYLLLRGYLLSWSLVFDHFSNASHKVRSHYSDGLKQGDYLSSFLDFTFNFLGRGGKSIDASRFNIASYDPDAEDSAKRDISWLILNLYFRILVLVPAQARNCWFDCSRAVRPEVEKFTEKFISPLVIEDALRRVSEWVGYKTTTEEKKLQVKVLKREVTAEYGVDDQTLRVRIEFPSAYPLQQVAVSGTNSVGIENKKWDAWLNSAKGEITFSGNSHAPVGYLCFMAFCGIRQVRRIRLNGTMRGGAGGSDSSSSRSRCKAHYPWESIGLRLE